MLKTFSCKLKPDAVTTTGWVKKHLRSWKQKDYERHASLTNNSNRQLLSSPFLELSVHYHYPLFTFAPVKNIL